MRLLKYAAVFIVTGLLLSSQHLLAQTYDVVVYGGTASGVIAAVSASRQGATVALVTPNQHLGGMVTNGLFHTDVGRPTVIGGTAKEFWSRADTYYAAHPVDRASFWFVEPHIAELIFNQMLSEAHVTIILNSPLKEKGGIQRQGPKIVSIMVEDGKRYAAKVFVDASYEGDLMAFSGTSYTFGREAQSKYKEYSGGVRAAHSENVSPFDEKGRLLPGILPAREGNEGDGDSKTQAYNYRLALTKDKNNQVPFPKPPGYDPRWYELELRKIQSAEKREGDDVIASHIFAEQIIVQGKSDSNLADFVGGSWKYPDGSYAERRKVIQENYNYIAGWYWFLANDPRLSGDFRKAIDQWGLAKDEFTDNHNWPYELYVREGRRMVGDYVMTQHDVVENLDKPDSVALGSYGLDSHPVQRFVDDKKQAAVEGAPQRTEEIRMKHVPYQIPYRALVPKRGQTTNLIVPVCASMSHVAALTVRLEPQYMMLGQAAGTAAAMAAAAAQPVQDVDVTELQKRLVAAHAILDSEK
jgi:hypothetical protein